MNQKYFCFCCNYDAKVKSSFDKHLSTKKHLMNEKNEKKVTKKSPKVTKKSPIVTIFDQKVTKKSPFSKLNECFECKYCSKKFKYKQGMYRHIKFTCKKNKDEDLKEFVKLMNEKMDELTKENSELKNSIYKEIEKRDKQIVKLTKKLQINNNNCFIQNNNIQLLNYKDTDLSHLSETDYIHSLDRVNNCVKFITEKIHFNPEKPENMNIYISNLKNDYVTVYENGAWKLKKGFDDIYDHKEILLEEWLEREQDNYPELRDKFEQYLDNKENDNIINEIKKDIKLMMYNNKNKIKLINN